MCQAAAHIHRFLSLDEDVLRMSADASEGLFSPMLSSYMLQKMLCLLIGDKIFCLDDKSSYLHSIVYTSNLNFSYCNSKKELSLG